MQGVIDVLAVKDGEAIIIDYKTNQNTTVEKLIKNYASQMKYYVEAVKKAINVKKITAYLYSTDLKSLIEI